MPEMALHFLYSQPTYSQASLRTFSPTCGQLTYGIQSNIHPVHVCWTLAGCTFGWHIPRNVPTIPIKIPCGESLRAREGLAVSTMCFICCVRIRAGLHIGSLGRPLWEKRRLGPRYSIHVMRVLGREAWNRVIAFIGCVCL